MKRLSFIVIIAMTIICQVDFILALSVKHTLRGLVKTSPLIITGKVSHVSSKIETERGREVVYTYVTIEANSVLKGKLDKSRLTVKMLGGRVGNKGGWSEKWIPMKTDEEVLLFLHSKDRENNIWEIKSISGKLSVVKIDGKKHFDCSMLRADEVSEYDSNPYFEKKVIIDRINGYILAKKGGK